MRVSRRRFVRTGRCPLVFIVSDSLSGDTSSRLLFPKDVQDELSIHHIRFGFGAASLLCSLVHLSKPFCFLLPSSFNPVAPTSMMKVLSRIATVESSKVTVEKRTADSFQHFVAHFQGCFHPHDFVFRALGGSPCLIRRRWSSCALGAQETSGAPSTACSSPLSLLQVVSLKSDKFLV